MSLTEEQTNFIEHVVQYGGCDLGELGKFFSSPLGFVHNNESWARSFADKSVQPCFRSPTGVEVTYEQVRDYIEYLSPKKDIDRDLLQVVCSLLGQRSGTGTLIGDTDLSNIVTTSKKVLDKVREMS